MKTEGKKIGRPKEWAPIPSWTPYEAHPDGRIRNGKYVLKQFIRYGVAWVGLYKDLRTHDRQLFVVPVARLIVWTFGPKRCIVCAPKPHNKHRHESIAESETRRPTVPLVHFRRGLKIFH